MSSLNDVSVRGWAILGRETNVPLPTTKKVVDKQTKAERREPVTLKSDEGNRPDTTLEGLTALAPVRRVRYWSSQLDAAHRARIETQLTRASEQRCHWAGLPLDRPLIMGIVNPTPDSLYRGSGDDPEAAIALGRAMREAGADIIDIGAESTRPGASPVGEEEELRRLEPVVRALAASGAVLSVDTRHAKVMAAAHG